MLGYLRQISYKSGSYWYLNAEITLRAVLKLPHSDNSSLIILSFISIESILEYFLISTSQGIRTIAGGILSSGVRTHLPILCDSLTILWLGFKGTSILAHLVSIPSFTVPQEAKI